MFSVSLKELRKSKKITQEKLAEIIGVERSTVGKWESKNIIPSIDILLILSNIFNVSVDYLIGNESNIKNKENSNGIRINVYGRVPAGIPIEAVENIVIACNGFALQIADDFNQVTLRNILAVVKEL